MHVLKNSSFFQLRIDASVDCNVCWRAITDHLQKKEGVHVVNADPPDSAESGSSSLCLMQSEMLKCIHPGKDIKFSITLRKSNTVVSVTVFKLNFWSVWWNVF